ncbi:MAG: 4Fe-4S dicluster domain-containing protein [ANME-2 cluster archaeon]|nr:4Fe-4S dicluster domain-containing protein [ANME-2 cluster archaeon]
MFNSLFGFLKVLDRISEKELVNIDRTKCLRYLNKHSSCSQCLENCPAGAIRIDGQEIEIDGFLCTGCGICVNICPNPAFSLKDIDPSSIIKASQEKKQLTISCSGKDTDLQVPCLGFINEAVLLRMASEGRKIVLDTSACQKCDYSTTQDTILGYVDAANSVLTCFNNDKKIHLKDDGPSIEPKHESITRKFIFHFSDTKIGEGYSRQSMFIDALKQLDPDSRNSMDASIIPFGSIKVHSSCNGCGICVALCPMDALVIEECDDFILKFRPHLCTGCGLCGQLCPEGSISLEENIVPGDLLKDELNLIDIKRIQCRECGRFFVAVHEQALCDSCRKDKDIEDSFFSHQ